MTHAEQIMQAVVSIVSEGPRTFTRKQVREQAGISQEDWGRSYSPTFQAMRVDQQGGAPGISSRFKGVFRQVTRGEHTLTEYGWRLIAEFKGT